MSMSIPESRQFAVVTISAVSTREVDLREFYVGGSGAGRTGSWPGDFKGRPQLATELRDLLERDPLATHSLVKRLTGARNLFRFLDEAEDLPPVASVADLNEIHGIRIKRWLTSRGITTPHTYQDVRTVVTACREMLGLPPLLWPARDPDPKTDVPEPDYKGVQRLTLAIRHEARAVKKMFREGDELADLGYDPRVAECRAHAWARPENHAWLTREITSASLPLKEHLTELNATGLLHWHANGNPVPGPTYLAPGMSERGRQGYVGKLRWYHPSKYETATFIWLVLLHTGWNLATVLGIDISKEKEWAEPHPQLPDFKVLHAWKGRSKLHQFAICQEQPEFHPYRVIRFMIDRTARLRETLHVRLRELEEEYKRSPRNEVINEIEDLRAAVKSPWLFHSLGKGGHVSWFTSRSSPFLNEYARTVARQRALVDDHPFLATICTSQIRDAWINYAYVSTGQSLVAQHAAGHGNQASLRHYLASRRYRRDSEKQFRVFQENVFAEITHARRLDPTILRILVTKGEFTAEAEARLLDVRYRTRRNMRCLSPHNPPKQIAPDHTPGEICRVQRCTGCSNGVAFDDALKPLAHALADLHAERRIRPLEAWAGTSLEDEERSITATLDQFDPETVRAAYQTRVEELESGQVRVFDVYPLY